MTEEHLSSQDEKSPEERNADADHAARMARLERFLAELAIRSVVNSREPKEGK